MSFQRKPKVVAKRGLKHKGEPVWGVATLGHKPIIELDKTLKGFNHLTILTHEAIHLAYPDMHEREVRAGAKLMASIIWGQNYRRVDQ